LSHKPKTAKVIVNKIPLVFGSMRPLAKTYTNITKSFILIYFNKKIAVVWMLRPNILRFYS